MRHAVRVVIVKDTSLLLMYRNKFGQEYYSLVGGGIDMGETPEQALVREVKEESSLDVEDPKLVIIEDAGPMYGMQYIFRANYTGGEIKLSPNSEEAKIHVLGANLFEPRWIPIADLPSTPLLPLELKQKLIEFLKSGFPEEPVLLTIQG